MFFEKKNLNLDYIETLGFRQEKVAIRVAKRPFCAISIRLNSKNTQIKQGNKTLSLQRGDIIFVPTVDYERRSDLDEVLCINFNTTDKIFTEIEHFRPSEPEKFIDLFFAVFNATRFGETHYEGAKGLYAILSEISKEIGKTAIKELRVQPALDKIAKEYGNRALSVGALSKECGLSESRFRQVFEEEVGTSPRKFITAVRIRHASALVREGGFKMSEIAERVGFCDEKYLSAVFTKNTGYSPKNHKKLTKTEMDGLL